MSETRQLAAIMFTDIVGYTVLMGEDEQKAFEILNKNRRLQKPIIEEYGGTWIKELGDGVLASFTTVSASVNAAVKIQEATKASEDFLLRIGIHNGEVVLEDNDIYGDAVNIASRIQALAPIGGILISESVYNHISNKKDIKTKFVRLEALKNVKEPVRIYEVIIESFQQQQNTSLIKSPDKTIQEKSIAVLPFVNMSSDPEQEYFSDGLTEDIITDLSHLEKLLVISRSSMMTLKGTNKKMKEIASEVNARYILEGSVRKAGNNLRITAQLIDAQNDVHLWAERYSGTTDDVFEIQEKVSRSIVGALEVKLTTREDTKLSSHPIQNAKAYEYYILARQAMWKRTEKSLDEALVFAQRGLDLVGDNSYLYAIIGSVYLYFTFFGIRSDPSFEAKANQYATKSLFLDEECAQAYLVLGVIAFKKRNIQEAANIFKKMLQLDPNSTDGLVWLMCCYIVVGRPEAALPVSEKLIQVDPLSIYSYQMVGDVKFYSGHIKESLPYFRWWLQKDPESPWARFLCAWNFAFNNELEECFAVLDSIITDTPTLIYAKIALFFKAALQGNKELALKHATEEMKGEAALLGLSFPIIIAWGYALIDEKDEAVKWLNLYLELGFSPYPLFLRWDTFHQVLKDHEGFQAYMKEIKRRSEQFVV